MKKSLLIMMITSALSCKNKTHDNIKSIDEDKCYTSLNYKTTDTLTLIKTDKLTYSFKFKHISKISLDSCYEIKGLATNIDPNGGAALEEFDPSELGEPTEIYLYQDMKYRCSIAIPLTVSKIVGVKLEFLNANQTNNKFLQMKLSE